MLKSKGSTKNCYRYCGEQFDSTTGLYYLRARYMDTSTGRFISMDTHQGSNDDPISLHKYLYANSNPVMYSDPSGYCSLAGVNTDVMGMTILDAAQIMANSAAFATGMKIIGMLSVTTLLAVTTYCVADYIVEIITTISSGYTTSVDINKQTRANIIEQAQSKSEKRENGWIIYGDLDSNGRATGAVAKITPNMIGGGTTANVPKITYRNSLGEKLDRGHLIAKNLGGDDGDQRNIVPIYNVINNGMMKHIEFAIAGMVRLYGKVYMTVIPVYIGDGIIPICLSVQVAGDFGVIPYIIPNVG